MIRILTYVFIMAAVTYLIRMIPMVVFKNKINNAFVKSFLFYVPYAVLGTMTFPQIFNATSSIISATVGTIIAIILAIREKGLLNVALSACFSVYITEFAMRIMNVL